MTTSPAGGLRRRKERRSRPQELQANAWLTVPADEELIFDDGLNDKWERSMSKIGVDFTFLTGDAGHA